MTLLYHSAEDIARSLTFEGLIAHLRQGHREAPAALDRLLMGQKSPSGTENSYLLLPAWQQGRSLGVKVVTVFPDNPKGPRPLPSVHAVYLLFDGSNGRPLAVLDGTELTYWKTAADSALAADYLARRDAKTLLMVGAGAMAPFLIRAHQSVRPRLERILVWNRSREKAVDLAAGWSKTPGLEVVDALEGAVERADIICCATASRSPLIAGSWLKPGVHLDLVGGFTPEMREADDEAIRRASIFVDCRDTTVDCVGDLMQPIAAGVISAADLQADLYDLCAGRHGGRRDAAEITLFKSGGGGHLDLMTAEYLAGILATAA